MQEGSEMHACLPPSAPGAPRQEPGWLGCRAELRFLGGPPQPIDSRYPNTFYSSSDIADRYGNVSRRRGFGMRLGADAFEAGRRRTTTRIRRYPRITRGRNAGAPSNTRCSHPPRFDAASRSCLNCGLTGKWRRSASARLARAFCWPTFAAGEFRSLIESRSASMFYCVSL